MKNSKLTLIGISILGVLLFGGCNNNSEQVVSNSNIVESAEEAVVNNEVSIEENNEQINTASTLSNAVNNNGDWSNKYNDYFSNFDIKQHKYSINITSGTVNITVSNSYFDTYETSSISGVTPKKLADVSQYKIYDEEYIYMVINNGIEQKVYKTKLITEEAETDEKEVEKQFEKYSNLLNNYGINSETFSKTTYSREEVIDSIIYDILESNMQIVSGGNNDEDVSTYSVNVEYYINRNNQELEKVVYADSKTDTTAVISIETAESDSITECINDATELSVDEYTNIFIKTSSELLLTGTLGDNSELTIEELNEIIHNNFNADMDFDNLKAD